MKDLHSKKGYIYGMQGIEQIISIQIQCKEMSSSFHHIQSVHLFFSQCYYVVCRGGGQGRIQDFANGGGALLQMGTFATGGG